MLLSKKRRGKPTASRSFADPNETNLVATFSIIGVKFGGVGVVVVELNAKIVLPTRAGGEKLVAVNGEWTTAVGCLIVVFVDDVRCCCCCCCCLANDNGVVIVGFRDSRSPVTNEKGGDKGDFIVEETIGVDGDSSKNAAAALLCLVAGKFFKLELLLSDSKFNVDGFLKSVANVGDVTPTDRTAGADDERNQGNFGRTLTTLTNENKTIKQKTIDNAKKKRRQNE